MLRVWNLPTSHDSAVRIDDGTSGPTPAAEARAMRPQAAGRETTRWRRRRLLACLATAVLAAGTAPPSAFAHPVHASIAEAEFNAKTATLEISIRVDPSDLENALRALAKRPLDLETAADLDRWILQYLQRSVRMTRDRARPLKLQLVGKELTPKFVWLYVAIRGPFPPGQWQFTQRMFLDLQADHHNTVTFRQGRTRRSLEFTARRPTQTLTLPLQPAAPGPDADDSGN